MQLLDDYRVTSFKLSNTPKYSYIKIVIDNYPVNSVDKNRLEELGWKESQSNCWIYA